MNSTSTSNTSNSSSPPPILPIEVLLAYAGFLPFDLITFQFVMPLIGLIGGLFGLLSVCIFFKRDFNQEPIYTYFRLIAMLDLLHLMALIPHGFCFVPRYLPQMSSYSCITYQLIYIPLSNLCFHYTGVIELAIILDRMKNFSLFVKRYFTFTPRAACLIFLAMCVLINILFAFNYKMQYAGPYSYTDSHGNERVNDLYIILPTEMASSKVGVSVIIALFVVRDIFTLIVGIGLNVALVTQMKRYVRAKEKRFNANRSPTNFTKTTAKTNINDNTIPMTSQEASGVKTADTHETKAKKLSRKSERNLSFMGITLCALSLISRLTIICCNTYFLLRTDYISLILVAISDTIIMLCPCCSFFVFYNFNNIFRRNVLKLRPTCFTLNIMSGRKPAEKN